MKYLYCRLFLIAVMVFAAASCKQGSPSIATITQTGQASEEVPSSSPTILPASPSPTKLPSPTHPSTPTFLPALPAGWRAYPDAQDVRAMAFDMQGNLWAGGPGGLFTIRPDGALEKLAPQGGFGDHEITAIRVTPDNAVWIATWGGGVWRFDGQDWQSFTTAEGLWDDYVHAIAFIPEEIYGELTLFFGTRAGLSIYSAGNWSNYIDAKYGLPADEVLSIITGPGGEIWVGTGKGAWNHAFDQLTYTTDNGLAGNQVNALTWAPDCSLWLATDGGVSRFDGESWTSYTSADGLVSDQVSSIAAGLDGSLWFGTAAGVSHFDGAGWENFTRADGLSQEQINTMLVAPDESVWMATSEELMRYSALDDRGETNASTSGLRVAYLKDGNIWLWSDGARAQLTIDGRVGSLKLSDDDEWIAFTRLRDGLENELWVLRSDGSDERLLVSAGDLANLAGDPQNELPLVIFHYEWVPNSYEIAFDTRRQVEGPGTFWSDDLRLVDVETGELTTLLANGQGGRFFYAPDGSKIAIATPQDISILSADGSYRLEKVLEYSNVLTYSEYRYYPQPVWSPDSQYLRVAIPFEDRLADPSQPVELWRIPVPDLPVSGDSGHEQATLLASVPAAPFISPPVSFSPDLTRIAYVQRVGDPQQNQRELHLANADGTEDRVIQTGTRMEFLRWAADGQHFAFSVGDPQLGVIAGVDGTLYPLSFNPLELTWVDGESYLHVVDMGCARELRLTHLNGESQAIDRTWSSPVSFDYIR